ncbi:hypothetical protein OEA41_007707 [Lepraria neglecta]|uniref:Uncharacterized protein n=1 Tax=Lepraria neglecta TaxID=209136 RepID=A0AAE0DNC1_9LECA|nr:hypothetical protein OEA41_007707 [Lepraria neglecta]
MNTEADAAEDKTLKQQYSRWRLWRGMVPPGQACSEERNLVFLGVVSNVHAALRCEISSLWAYAWLNGKLDEPVRALSKSKSNIVSEDRHQGGCKTLSQGRSSTAGGDIYYETPLCHALVTGGTPGARGGGVVGGSYGQSDYRGLVDEWLTKEAKGKTKVQ